jgi:V/A-type H+-transporting ATPase subunit A
LGQIYDGLQNPLENLAMSHGTFLPRGVYFPALDLQKKWSFMPSVEFGTRLRAGDPIGTVQEGRYTHKIAIPFDEPEEVKVTWIQQGTFTVDTPIARIQTANGKERTLTMTQQWPVRRSLSDALLTQRFSERLYPEEPLITTQRIIDTFFPIAKGGTGCIPGPFGAGKTVLQGLISRFSAVDIVIVVACGERAGEVVETIAEFPQLIDPKTGSSLMERTIIICNTSSMPVAAREASIYTGITLGEYYRQMGYDVLLIADSTSRWAQAMRETSGRMEEIPGEEAFPAYLDSSIKGIYERAGVIRTNDGSIGTLTMIGTVSPAGGNFEEPVTQSTLSTVKTFLGLSAERAYKRFFPAVDPLISWSRYLNQLEAWFAKEVSPDWIGRVREMLELLERGDSIYQMMQVTGEEGTMLEDFVTYQKSLFLDMVYLQQDAFDDVDACAPLPRQKEAFGLVYDLVNRHYRFDDKPSARDYFTRLTSLFKNLNYTSEQSPERASYLQQISTLARSVSV